MTNSNRSRTLQAEIADGPIPARPKNHKSKLKQFGIESRYCGAKFSDVFAFLYEWRVLKWYATHERRDSALGALTKKDGSRSGRKWREFRAVDRYVK